MSGRIWSCKIGEVASTPRGADFPMREAVSAAYLALTGEEPVFLFSGWGAELTEPERAVVENRVPSDEWFDAHKSTASSVSARAGQEHPCPNGDRCALNNGAVHCFACGRNWPPDETWEKAGAGQSPPSQAVQARDLAAEMIERAQKEDAYAGGPDVGRWWREHGILLAGLVRNLSSAGAGQVPADTIEKARELIQFHRNRIAAMTATMPLHVQERYLAEHDAVLDALAAVDAQEAKT